LTVLRACEVDEELDTGAGAALVDREVPEQERGSTVATARRRRRARSRPRRGRTTPQRVDVGSGGIEMRRSNRARENKQEEEGRGHTIPAFL